MYTCLLHYNKQYKSPTFNRSLSVYVNVATLDKITQHIPAEHFSLCLWVQEALLPYDTLAALTKHKYSKYCSKQNTVSFIAYKVIRIENAEGKQELSAVTITAPYSTHTIMSHAQLILLSFTEVVFGHFSDRRPLKSSVRTTISGYSCFCVFVGTSASTRRAGKTD